MKIAFTFLTYGEDVFGGIENALYNLTDGLDKLGHKCYLFTSGAYVTNKDKLPAEIFISQHLPIKYDGKVLNLINSLENNAACINADFNRFLDHNQPDYVVVVDPIWGILPVIKYNFAGSTPYAISYHVANKWDETKSIMRESFSLPFKKFFSVSDFLSTEIKEEFFEANNIKFTILPNSIDCTKYHIQKSPDEKYIFCNSRIARGKNIEVLVKAYVNLAKEKPIKLKLCAGKFPFGDENELNTQISSLITKHGINNLVEMLPLIKWQDLPDIISKATIIVLPSTYETFGIAALEASVAGVPLIVAEATNFKFLVKKSAIYFDPNNEEDLLGKLVNVLDNYRYFKTNAMKFSDEYVEKYHNKVVAERFINELCCNDLL